MGKDNCFGAREGNIKTGPLTFFRMHTDDELGACAAYFAEEEFTDDACAMDGGISCCRIHNLRKVLRHIAEEGTGHHLHWSAAIAPRPFTRQRRSTGVERYTGTTAWN